MTDPSGPDHGTETRQVVVNLAYPLARKEKPAVTNLNEISRTVRAALVGWPETARLILIVIVLTTAFVLAIRLT